MAQLIRDSRCMAHFLQYALGLNLEVDWDLSDGANNDLKLALKLKNFQYLWLYLGPPLFLHLDDSLVTNSYSGLISGQNYFFG